MRKLVVFLLLFWIAAGSVRAEGVILYPLGYDTVTEGASSVRRAGDQRKSPYFAHPDFFRLKSGGSLFLLEGFKTYQQTTEWSCGNAAALMVLWHFGETGYEERELAARMGTNPLPADGAPVKGVLYGTTAAGLAGFFREIGYKTESSIEQPAPTNPYKFRDWVTGHLRENTPLLVDWLDWGGHWQVIIGYDTMGTDNVYDDVLILADPYDVGDHWQDGYYIFPAYRFYYMWQDPFFQPAGHKEKQWVVARPAA